MALIEPGAELTVRPADPADAVAMADLYTAARVAAVPSMPPAVHTNDEDRAWLAAALAGRRTGWVAERGGELAGYALVEDDWLDHLFVRPDLTGSGVGSMLLDVVKSIRPRGFCLWVFESNAGARRFYARHGLVELERTDGSANEERAPDIRMAWPGADPQAFLQSLLDDVDRELALAAARREALVRALREL